MGLPKKITKAAQAQNEAVLTGIWATMANNLTEALHNGFEAAKSGDKMGVFVNIEKIGNGCRFALERIQKEMSCE